MNLRRRTALISPCWLSTTCLISTVLFVYCRPLNAFTTSSPRRPGSSSKRGRRMLQHGINDYCSSSRQCRPPVLHAATIAAEIAVAAAASQQQQSGVLLSDYAPAAASLFNNMKLPAAVVTAGMISLGFATRFPELPRDSLEKVYSKELRQKCAKLERLHIVLGLISVTSELIVVLWAAVEVNQLTERTYEPAYSVWDLIHRDCDLAWSAVNSHYILGIIGFTGMLWLRAYVMLLSANASQNLMNAASTGTAAALCLMVSIVNRGVESGGGNAADRYGNTILDLVVHYASLLLKVATNDSSPGPLQLSAIVLEIASLCFMLMVLVKESDTSFEEQVNDEDDACPTDASDVLNDTNEVAKLSTKQVEKLKTCVALEEEEQIRQRAPPALVATMIKEEENNKRKLDDSGDYSSVNVSS